MHESGRTFVPVDVAQLVDGDEWLLWFLWVMQRRMVMDARIMSNHCVRMGLE